MVETKHKIVTTSWDDGHPLDFKLADILTEYGINGTFYVPFSNPEREVMDAVSIVELAAQFEIGGHTRNHVDLRRIGCDILDDEIGKARLELQDLLGRPVNMFCYPKGKHNERVQSAVMRAGFIGARTTQEFITECCSDVLQMPTTLQACPHSASIRVRHALLAKNLKGALRFSRMGVTKTWVEIARCFFEEMLETGGVWHLWGHSWEIEEYNLWDDLRAVLDTVRSKEGVTYFSNGQVMENIAKLST